MQSVRPDFDGNGIRVGAIDSSTRDEEESPRLDERFAQERQERLYTLAALVVAGTVTYYLTPYVLAGLQALFVGIVYGALAMGIFTVAHLVTKKIISASSSEPQEESPQTGNQFQNLTRRITRVVASWFNNERE